MLHCGMPWSFMVGEYCTSHESFHHLQKFNGGILHGKLQLHCNCTASDMTVRLNKYAKWVKGIIMNGAIGVLCIVTLIDRLHSQTENKTFFQLSDLHCYDTRTINTKGPNCESGTQRKKKRTGQVLQLLSGQRKIHKGRVSTEVDSGLFCKYLFGTIKHWGWEGWSPEDNIALST